MERAYKFRIYPNKEQKVLIQKTFGCCRFVYNQYLGKRIEMYKSTKKLAKLQKELSRKTIGSSNHNKARIKVTLVMRGSMLFYGWLINRINYACY